MSPLANRDYDGNHTPGQQHWQWEGVESLLALQTCSTHYGVTRAWKDGSSLPPEPSPVDTYCPGFLSLGSFGGPILQHCCSLAQGAKLQRCVAWEPEVRAAGGQQDSLGAAALLQ